MKRTALTRLTAASVLLAFSAAASAAVKVDFSGTTHLGSNAVAPGLPISGSFSFDDTAVLPGFSNSTTANFSAPGSAQFTVGGQTHTYSTLFNIFLDSANGAIVFGFSNGPDIVQFVTLNPNIDLSSAPSAGQLSGLFFLDACTPGQGIACTGLPSRIYAEVRSDLPEPATWAMMLLGFGVIGFAFRRQRKAGLTQTP